jgi:deoxyribose-phosphate aldolase
LIDLTTANARSLGQAFDHSVLAKDVTEQDIRSGAREAIQYNCAAFYASSPYWLPVIVEELKDSDVRPAVGIGFPGGSADWQTKVSETRSAIARGARDVDVVMNIGALRSARYADVAEELNAFVEAAEAATTKVILDVAFLTDDEIRRGADLVIAAGADYVKTSTGQYEGPSMHQFIVMRDAVAGTGVKTKVAGVKFPRPQNAYAFLLAGADLIGTRAVPEIIDALTEMRSIGLVPSQLGGA